MGQVQKLSADLSAASQDVVKLSERLGNLKKGTKEYADTVDKLNEANKRRLKLEKQLEKSSNGLIKGNKNHVKSIKAKNEAMKQSAGATKAYTTATKNATGAQKGFFGVLGTRIGTLAKYLIATKLITAAVGALSAVFIGGARKAIELDKALADMSAIAGLTRTEMERLKGVVFDVAGVTSLTAKEVVELQKELAKLGVPVDDIANLTKPVALLAQALNESAGEVGQTLQKIQNAFGLTSEEALDTANTLLGAINESALTLQDLGTGLQYAGAAAKASGVSYEETAALLGVLANNGIKASAAGTGLRKLFIELAKEGVTWNEFLEDMAENNISLAEAQDRFGTRAANQVVIIAQNVDEYRNLNAELVENNRLFAANAKQMGSTQGQLDLLNSAWDKFLINFSDFITHTDAFIYLLSRLDPEAAGVAEVYRELAAENEVVSDAMVELTNDMVTFGEETKGTYNSVQAHIDIMVEMGHISESQGKVLLKNFQRSGMAANEFGRFLEKNNAELVKTYEGATKLASEEAKVITDRNIAQAAANATYADHADRLEELRQLAIKGNLTDEQKLEFAQRLEQQLKRNQQFREDETDVNRTLVYEKRIKLYERLQEELKNVVNAEREADGSGDKERFDLKRFEVETDRRIQLLKDRRAFELEAAKTVEERNDIEIEYARLIANAYGDMSDEIAVAWGAVDQSLYSNGVSVENLISKYEKLSYFTGEEAVKIFQGFVKGFDKEVKDAISEANEQLKNGEIKVDEYNATIAAAIEKQKEVVKQGFQSLVSTGELTQEQANQLSQAIDNIEVDPQKKFDADQTFLGRLFGIDATDYIGETAEMAAEEYAEDVNERLLEVANLGIKELADVQSKFAKERIDNIKNEADAELDIVRERYKIEEQILKSSLDNQLITESQYRIKQQELKRAQLVEENAINRKVFEQEKQQDRVNAIVLGAEQIALVLARELAAKGFPQGLATGAAASGIIAASTTARVAAINQRKFYPKKFEQGGIVEGPSHAEGGVPFTVQGRGGYEMEGGEFIINKRAAAMHKDLLERINNSGRQQAIVGTRKFANGGQVVGQQSDESIEYLRAIAEATTGTMNNTGKPVRAFVSNKDLTKDSRERSVRQKNDRV